MTRYVALYCRISKDKSGRVEGVKAQEKWGREYAAERWPGIPVRVFADNDISAFDEDAHRPEYEALRAAVADGEVLHVWAVEQSRLERREVPWFVLAAELDGAGIPVLHTNRDGVVELRGEVAGIKAVLNAAEIRKMKKRLMDTLRDKAERGLPAGSRPFGYTHGVNERGAKTLHVVEAEATVIRECATRVLDGWSLSSIAADLRSRGLQGPHKVKVIDHRCSGNRRKKCGCPVRTVDGTPVEDGGKPVTRPSTITNQSVKSWVTNPTVAGHRVHQGHDRGPRTGNWTPILGEGTWQAVRNKLAGPRVVQRVDGGTYPITPTTRTTGRRYLLTGGTAICGECSMPLTASMKHLTRKRADGTRVLWKHAPYYFCHPRKGGRACVGIMGDQLEAYVVGRLLDELDNPAFVAQFSTDEHVERREKIAAVLRAIEDQRVDLSKMWSLPFGDPNKLTTAEWQAARAGLAEEERRLRAELATVPAPATGIDAERIRIAWHDGMTLDEQRDVISRFINTVTLRKARPGTARFDENRVAIEWRTS
ncbi:recombinase family protein [Dactylosporangium sp. NPDC051485]|uniref:recombinase family protein n=1 Tax=Dactylosporangium sp. NPDC051485 TaxID=3154846 RepID=UPI0034462F1B